jgi:hypothetical protein
LHCRTFSRLVYARIRRSTDRQASVPEETKRTISTEGTRSMTILASTFCIHRQAWQLDWMQLCRQNSATIFPRQTHAISYQCQVMHMQLLAFQYRGL